MRFLKYLCSLISYAVIAANLQAEVIRLEIEGISYPIPIKIYLPEQKPAPVVIFSHGLGGSREGSKYLGEHWSNAGFAVIAVQHPGSDESVWKDLPKWKISQAMKDAASPQSFVNRIQDIRTTLDYIEASSAEHSHPLQGKLDPERIALAGHSFGAVTTQAFMGQSFFRARYSPYTDSRIDCFILMSPSQSKNLSNEAAFGSVKKPVLCMTGTKDDSPLRRQVTPETRKQVYAALPPGAAYQVVFDKGAHSIFGDYRKNDQRYHAAIEVITTQFIDAYLKEDTKAQDWLRSDETRECLSEKDLWGWK